MQTIGKRYTQIDICRGFGIALVVLGHALKQVPTENSVVVALIAVIYSFHMPLFFVLAGFTAHQLLCVNKLAERMDYIKKRSKRLLLPYFIMSAIYIPLKMMMSAYAIRPYDFSQVWRILIGDSPDTLLWFLYVLFLINVLCAIFLTRKRMSVFLACSFIITLLTYTMKWELKLTRYLFFFLLGLYGRMLVEEKSQISVWKRWNRGSVIAAACVAFCVGNVLGQRLSDAWFLLTALSGSYLALAASGWIMNRRSGRFWMTLGKYSMDIYLFSDPVMIAVRLIAWNILRLSAAICIILCFLSSLLLPVFISWAIVRRVSLFRKLFLGMDG